MMNTEKLIESLDDLTQKQLNILGCTLSHAHKLSANEGYSLTAKNKLIDNEWHRSDFLHYINVLEDRYNRIPNEHVFITDILCSIQMIITALKLTKFDAKFLSEHNTPE